MLRFADSRGKGVGRSVAPIVDGCGGTRAVYSTSDQDARARAQVPSGSSGVSRLGGANRSRALGGAGCVDMSRRVLPVKPATTVARKPAEAEEQLKSFVAKFEPRHQTLIRAVRKELRKRCPTAYEVAYDNYNFFVLGYGPTERPSDCILSMAAGANGVGLCFIRGASLPDPSRILLGSGNQTRFIRLESVSVLARPEVEALVAAALALAKAPMRANGGGDLIIRSVSAKQRPRRRSAK